MSTECTDKSKANENSIVFNDCQHNCIHNKVVAILGMKTQTEVQSFYNSMTDNRDTHEMHIQTNRLIDIWSHVCFCMSADTISERTVLASELGRGRNWSTALWQ